MYWKYEKEPVFCPNLAHVPVFWQPPPSPATFNVKFIYLCFKLNFMHCFWDMAIGTPYPYLLCPDWIFWKDWVGLLYILLHPTNYRKLFCKSQSHDLLLGHMTYLLLKQYRGPIGFVPPDVRVSVAHSPWLVRILWLTNHRPGATELAQLVYYLQICFQKQTGLPEPEAYSTWQRLCNKHNLTCGPICLRSWSRTDGYGWILY